MIFVFIWLLCGALALAFMYSGLGKGELDALIAERNVSKWKFYMITVALGPLWLFVWLLSGDE